MEGFQCVVPYHTYSLGHVMLFVSLVLSAATSMRGTSRVMEMVMASLSLPCPAPSWFSGRLWLLRLGYYKLTRAQEHADDWAWIVDHTVQLGAEKCFVILGIRLSALPPAGRCLSHEDVEPLALVPVKASNGEVVWQQLEATIEKTGVPRAIIGDHGSDLKAGVDRFCQKHPETRAIYDIKHKTAAVLKQELHADETWQEFTRLATQTKHKIQQTAFAFLAPPNQRAKARYMNIEPLIRWGRNLLVCFDTQSLKGHAELDQQLLEEKLGWIRRFREQLHAWGALLQMIEVTENFVRRQGLYHGCHLALHKQLLVHAHTERTKKVCTHLVTFVLEESLKAKPSERLLGSSEVIESVFGKLKRLEQDQAKSGFTGLLLSVAAMVSTTTREVMHKALETVSTKHVRAWCKKTLGQSVQAKRREAFASHKETEQKWDQFEVAV